MAHYWTADDPVETRQAQLDDWLEDLVEFGPQIVAEACGEWRRRPGGRRPTPGDIRQLAIEARDARPDQEQPMLPAPDYHQRRAALAARNADRHRREAAEGREICNRWARGHGFADFDEAMRHGKTHADVVRSILGDAPALKGVPSPAEAIPQRLYDPDVLASARRELGLETTEVAE